MTLKLIATDGDTENQDSAHIPPVGSGTYYISPVTLQDFVFIKNKKIIPSGQEFEAHGTATCVASSDLLFINGLAVVRNSDSVSHHHSNSGVYVSNQDFVYSE